MALDVTVGTIDFPLICKDGRIIRFTRVSGGGVQVSLERVGEFSESRPVYKTLQTVKQFDLLWKLFMGGDKK